MDTPEKLKRRWWRRKMTWAAVTVLWLGLYVLSYGPACRIYWRSEDPRVWDVIDAIYFPLEWPSLHVPGYYDALGWYAGLWRPPEWDEPCFLRLPGRFPISN